MTQARLVGIISDLRQKNNQNWMKLLSIALKHAPKETKGVLKRINAYDAAISTALRELAK